MSFMRIKLRNSEVAKNGANPSPECSKSAKHSKTFRDRLKSDPEVWAAFKTLEAQRARERRARRTEEQKERDRFTNRGRQKRLYNKRKKEGEHFPLKKKQRVLTRSEKVKRAEYNKIKKRESREKRTPQQKRRDREKDARDHAARRAAINKKKKKKKSTVLSPSPVGFSSNSARRMALSRIWSKVPNDPDKFADIVQDFLTGSRSTPKKQAVLHARGLTTKKKLVFEDVTNSLKEKISSLGGKRDKVSQRDRRLLISSVIIRKKYRKNVLARAINVRLNYFSSIEKRSTTDDRILCQDRQKRKDATCLDVVQNVQNFYQEAKISRELPYMKSVKQQTQKRVMEVCLQKAYSLWTEDNPDAVNVVSFSLFQKLRPDTVLLQNKTKLNQCLCEYCTDVLLKLQAKKIRAKN